MARFFFFCFTWFTYEKLTPAKKVISYRGKWLFLASPGGETGKISSDTVCFAQRRCGCEWGCTCMCVIYHVSVSIRVSVLRMFVCGK